MNETNQAPNAGGTKLSTIFLVVLGLHVVVLLVLAGIYVVNSRSKPMMAESGVPTIEEGSPLITSETATAPGSIPTEPVVETTNAPIISNEMIDTMADSGPQSPMPPSNDPVWVNSPSDAAPQTASQSDLATTSTELQTPPARLEMEPQPVAPAPVAPVVPKKAAVVAVSKPKTYSVAAGDNLTKIARKNGTTVAKLKQANGLSTDALKIGQVLKVPGTTTASAAVAKTPAKKSSPVVASASSGQSSYQVAAGDNLTKIAKKTNTTVSKLKQANGLTADNLKIGQILKVPGSAATKASPKAAPVREAEARSTVKKPFREPVITMDMARL